MAHRRIILLAGLLVGGFQPSTGLATPQGATAVQYYQPERGYSAPPGYRYAPAPQGRQVCWTEQRRVHVGYDNWGRALYRRVPQRVCRWQRY